MDSQSQLFQNFQSQQKRSSSRTEIPFNPQNSSSLSGIQVIPYTQGLTSAFGEGGVASDAYNSFQIVAQALETKKLEGKFNEIKEEVKMMKKNPERFRKQELPLARIRNIMKSDEDVRMISAETPVVFAKACELFIIELAHRAWTRTEEEKRRTLQKKVRGPSLTGMIETNQNVPRPIPQRISLLFKMID